ncbi:uncharacterized protein LOC142768975 isoform X1 [Rhipicephalus microplus]|uniref:uncharacterized protein LOC142768975 isoform X1 n=1 Tax=Rhipicephalus microplus TaxID=6941 RepID=UPI003F6A9908
MAAVDASLLFIALLVSFCTESFEAGEWTEIIPANTHEHRALAEYAYTARRDTPDQGVTFLVTQARWKVQRGTVYNIAFIVFFQNTMIEKCITTVELPPIHQLRLTRRVTKFWCRPVP